MKFFILLCSLLSSSFAIHAQNGLNLPYLVVENTSLKDSFTAVNDFLGSRPNGKSFPICKISFTGPAESLSYSIQAIDNSWSDLFKYGEVCYGYVVEKNRMFILFSNKSDLINFEGLLYSSEQYKLFNNLPKPASWDSDIPKWYYKKSEKGDNTFEFISADNLGVL